MVLERDRESMNLDGTEYFVGMNIIGTKESEYEGLKGRLIEIRTDPDKDTDNEDPDIYYCFEAPEDSKEIKKLEEVFSELYDEPKASTRLPWIAL